MDDVFIPQKVDDQDILDVLLIQSSVPLLKKYIELLRQPKNDELTLPFYIDIEELICKLIAFVLDKEIDDNEKILLLDFDDIPNQAK